MVFLLPNYKLKKMNVWLFLQEKLERDYKSVESDLLQVREQLSLVENLSIFREEEGEAQFQSINQFMREKLKRIDVQIDAYPLNAKLQRMQRKEKQHVPDEVVTPKVS